MAISDTQKVDYLWKKLGYGATKTDTNANKFAPNEAIPSPLILRGDKVWQQASSIPGTLPGSSSGVVTVYPTSNPREATEDITATTSRTWKTGLTDWIPPEIGSTYQAKVYIHTSGDAANAASAGTQVFATGSGNDDEWFFDYQSGVLHFIGTNLPNGVSFTGKSVYVSGGRYTGTFGVGSAAILGNLEISDTTITTATAGDNIILDGETGYVEISGTSGFIIPVGNTSQRPGSPTTGITRYNSETGLLEIYDGSAWESMGDYTATVDSFNGDNSTTDFVMSAESTTDGTIVDINGVVQLPTTAYTVSGNTISFTEAPGSGDKITTRLLVSLVGTTAQAGGSDTQVQFNDGDVIAGDSGFTFNKTTNAVTVTGNITGGNVAGTTVTGTNVKAGNLTLNGDQIQSSDATANLVLNINGTAPGPVLIDTSLNFTPTGNLQISGQYIGSSASLSGTLTATGNITGGNLTTGGRVTTSGPAIIGSYATVGAQLTAYSLVVNNTSTLTGNVGGGNVSLSGQLSATGNITGGNLITAGSLTVNEITISGTDGSAGQALLTYGNGVTYFGNVASSGLGNIVEDTTPQLGGDLDLNSNDINGSGNVNVTGNISATTTITATGNVTGGNLVTSADVTTATVTASGNISVGGILLADVGTHEKFSSLANATSTVTHDCSNGHIFYHTTPSADFTANFTNLNLGNTYATTTTLVVIQGATARIANAVQIGGSSQTINWQGGSEPVGTNNGIDVITFSILNNAGTYTVLGQLVDF